MRRDGGSSSRRGSFDDLDMVETVVKVKPVSKVTKGGRDRRFNALVVVGDRKGKVGVGQGKAREVSEAIRKGTQTAQRAINLFPAGLDRQAGAVGLHRLLFKFFNCSIGDLPALVDDQDPVAQSARLLHNVGAEDDGFVLGELFDQLADIDNLERIQA